MNDPVKAALKRVEALRDLGTSLLMELIRRPAVNPSFGGEGEHEKAMYLYKAIGSWGFDDIKIYSTEDPRAKNGERPNIVATIEGKVQDKLWIITHLDVVPPGDLSAWTITEPFTPKLAEDKVYGRGAEDNGQSMVASLMAARALLELGLRPRRTVALAFVSDEEAGSDYGLGYLLREHRELFGPDDVALVPDAGSSDGLDVEIAEKSILWVRARIRGVQAHASMPEKGLNPNKVMAELIRRIGELLETKYSDVDRLFDPPTTTCEPTAISGPAVSPNIIPGEAQLTFDCRVLPRHSVDSLLDDLRRALEDSYRAVDPTWRGSPAPEVEILQRDDAPQPTPPDSDIVRVLSTAIRELRGREPRLKGIGGGTVARLLRRAGIPTAVWSTIDETAHQPNEYARVDNMVEDAKVMAYLMLSA